MSHYEPPKFNVGDLVKVWEKLEGNKRSLSPEHFVTQVTAVRDTEGVFARWAYRVEAVASDTFVVAAADDLDAMIVQNIPYMRKI